MRSSLALSALATPLRTRERGDSSSGTAPPRLQCGAGSAGVGRSITWGPRNGPPTPPDARGAPAEPWHPSISGEPLQEATMAKGTLIAAMIIGQAAEDEFHDWYDTE